MSRDEPPNEGRRERKRREIRERLYTAGQELFSELGYDNVTVEQIADRADVSRATFFNYFSSKGSLLRGMAERLTEVLHRHLEDTGDPEIGTSERLRRFFRHTAEVVQKTERLTRDLFVESMRGNASDAETESEITGTHDAYESMVREGQNRGDVDPRHDPALMAEIIGGTLTALLSSWLNDSTYPLVERAEAAATFLGQAMAPKERKEGDS